MSVHVGFHKTLLKLGKWRFGIGYRMNGTTGLIMVCVYGIMNLLWYMLLACFWILYGIVWLFFVLPIKGFIKLYKKRDTLNNTAVSISECK